MAVNLKGRSFLTLQDFTPAEIRYLLDLGHDLKAKRRAGICDPALKGKHIVLLFEKTSTRTAGEIRRGSCLERPYRRRPSHPDPGRHDDH